MSDSTDAAGDSGRLDEFHQEVGKLRASGGRANPDRWVFRIGLIFTWWVWPSLWSRSS